MAKKASYEVVSSKFECSGPGLIRKGKAEGRFIQGERPGSINKANGLRVVEIAERNYCEHHLVWLLTTGKWSKHQIEHIDGDKQNNRFENLRQVDTKNPKVDADFVRQVFDYKGGLLVYRKKWSPRSMYKIGDTFGYVDNQEGYRYGKIQGKRYKHADLVWLYHEGRFPKRQLDHINRDRCDDRIENLREATPKQNARNRGLNANNTSGVKGVVFNQGKWVARIGGINGEGRIFLGSFKTKEEAAAARLAAEKLLGYTGG